MLEALLNQLYRFKNWFKDPVESSRKRRATDDPEFLNYLVDSKCRRLEPTALMKSSIRNSLYDENIFALPKNYHRRSTLPLTPVLSSDLNTGRTRKSPRTIGSIILDDEDDEVIEVPYSNEHHLKRNRNRNRFTSTPTERQQRHMNGDDVCFVKEYKIPGDRTKSGSSKLSFNVSDVLNSLSLNNGSTNSVHFRTNGINNRSNGTKPKMFNPSKKKLEDSVRGNSSDSKNDSLLSLNYRMEEKEQYQKLLEVSSPYQSIYSTPPSKILQNINDGSTGSRGRKMLAMANAPEPEKTRQFLHKAINYLDKEPIIVVTDTDSDVEILPTPPSPKPDIKVAPVNTLKPIIDSSQATKEVWLNNLVQNHKEFQREKLNRAEEYVKQDRALHDINSKILIGTLSNQVDKCLAIRDEVVIPLEEEEEEIPLPELTSKHEQIIRKAFSGNPSEVLVKKFKMSITRRDILTLRGTNWLNDEVINFYMNLITERGEQGRFLKCYTMNTFFYPKLSKEGPESLKRWTRRVDIFSYDIICIPIHLSVHWCMAIIDFRNSSIKYYDSMHGNNVECVRSLRDYLEFEHMDKKKEPFDTSDFKLEVVKDIPQQMNGSDCGVFSCMFAEYLSRNSKITFSQEQMQYFRKKMVVEIINGELMIQ